MPMQSSFEGSQALYRTLWDLVPDAVVVVDSDQLIRFANPAVWETFGHQPDDLVGKPLAMLQPERLRAAHRDGFSRYIASHARSLDWRRVELTALHANGREIPVELSFAELQLDDSHWFVGIFRDVTERKTHEAALLHSANYDSLTGLPNRSLLFDRFDKALASAKRHGRRLGVLYIDLDNFKVINDTLGHDSGDLLLCQAAERIQACVRDGDTVARTGGDEFVVLLAEVGQPSDLARIADRMLKSMRLPFQIGEAKGFSGASIGSCLFPEDGASRTELLRRADLAMYKAKEKGRNRVQHYSEKLQEQIRSRMAIEQALRMAIERGELQLHYQPQVDLGSGRIVAAEALLRWHNAELGAVAPDRFIPIAENTGMIVSMGAWVIERACRDLAHWRQRSGASHCRIAINLSPRQFEQDALQKVIDAAIERHGVPASALEFEITESHLMTDPDHIAKVLHDLRDAGCTIALDDFGTGYSSLSYLRNLPLDCLKIDKSLVMDVSILVAVIQLARSFRLKTIAEGVEDEHLATLLRELGCDMAQGYHFARPMPLSELTALEIG